MINEYARTLEQFVKSTTLQAEPVTYENYDNNSVDRG